MKDLAALHDMTLFVEVARTASFSRASANLDVPRATLSRRIAAMERRFGVRLFERSTRKVDLTDAGQRYFERCGDLVDQARIAQEVLRESTEQPTGPVRVSMPVDLGVHHVGPLMPEFAARFPEITVDFDLSPRNRKLVGDQVDVAIRIGAVNGDANVVRRIGMVAIGLYASPAYLKRQPALAGPADLAAHECIVLPPLVREPRWKLQREDEQVDVQVRGHFTANNLGLMRVLAEGGLGIAVLPHSLAAESVQAGQLVPVLPGWQLTALPLHAVTASRLQPARVKVFVEFLAARLNTS